MFNSPDSEKRYLDSLGCMGFPYSVVFMHATLSEHVRPLKLIFKFLPSIYSMRTLHVAYDRKPNAVAASMISSPFRTRSVQPSAKSADFDTSMVLAEISLTTEIPNLFLAVQT